MTLQKRSFVIMCFIISIFIFSPLHALAHLDIGVATHMNNYNKAADVYGAMIKNYGFNSVRDGFSWNSVQNGVGDFNMSRKGVNADLLFSSRNAVNNSLQTLFVLGYGNDAYTQGNYPRTRDQVDKFINYVAWVANRYKGKVKYYEVWNEWLLGTGIGSTKKRPDDKIFMYLVEQSYITIKKIDPDAMVLTGSINPLHKNEVDWLHSLIHLGLMGYVDGISIHPYAFNEPRDVRDPEGSFFHLDGFEKELNDLTGKTVPLYITEMGYPTGTGFSGGISTMSAAQNIVKYTLLSASRGYIKGLWWYDLIDDGPDPRDKEDNFGLFYQNKNEKESARLLKVLLPIIRNSNVSITENNGKNYTVNLQGKETFSWVRGRNYTFQEWLDKINTLNN